MLRHTDDFAMSENKEEILYTMEKVLESYKKKMVQLIQIYVNLIQPFTPRSKYVNLIHLFNPRYESILSFNYTQSQLSIIQYNERDAFLR